MTMSDLSDYAFLSNALIVGVLVSLCAALLGVTLVLKRFSMIGDGLSHVGFGALSIAMACNLAPLEVSIPLTVLAAVLLLRISENGRIRGDAAIAIISSSAMAIGVIITSLTGANISLDSYLFGSILALNQTDVWLSVAVSVVVLISYVFFYNKLFAITFDEIFSRATGIRAKQYNLLIALLTALIVVIGMRMMGTLLMSSLIIFPGLSSMRMFGSFRRVIVSSAILSVLCFLTGLTLSVLYPTPTGATVVAVNLVAFLLSFGVSLVKKRTR